MSTIQDFEQLDKWFTNPYRRKLDFEKRNTFQIIMDFLGIQTPEGSGLEWFP